MTERSHNAYPAPFWLEKMDHDLIAIRMLLKADDAPTDVVCFHAQQAVEKALKAILAAHSIVPDRTHDLVALLDDVIPLGVGLESESPSIAPLNEYAVGVRYPFHMAEPSIEDTKRAAMTAERVCSLVRAYVEKDSINKTKHRRRL
jgi:HEPN domain-containing protein